MSGLLLLVLAWLGQLARPLVALARAFTAAWWALWRGYLWTLHRLDSLPPVARYTARLEQERHLFERQQFVRRTREAILSELAQGRSVSRYWAQTALGEDGAEALHRELVSAGLARFAFDRGFRRVLAQPDVEDEGDLQDEPAPAFTDPDRERHVQESVFGALHLAGLRHKANHRENKDGAYVH